MANIRYAVTVFALGDPSNPPKDAVMTEPNRPWTMRTFFRDYPKDENVALQIAKVEAEEKDFREVDGWIRRYVYVHPVSAADLGPQLSSAAAQSVPGHQKLIGETAGSNNGNSITDSGSETADAKVAHVKIVVQEWLAAKLPHMMGTPLWGVCKEKDRTGLLLKLFCGDENAMQRCREELINDEIEGMARQAIEQLYPELLQAAAV